MRLKHLIVTTAVIIALFTGISSFAQTTNATGTVTAYHLNARTTPFASAPIVAVLDRGYTTSIIGKTSNSSWYQIIIGGTPAWVNASYLSVTNAHTVPVTYTITSTTTTAITATVNTGRLNMRSAPFVNATLIGTISQGDVVTVIGKNSNSSWYEVTFNNTTGWVNGSYLTIYNTHLVPITYTSVTPPANISATVNTGRLNMRSAPSVNASIVYTITEGDVVAVIAKNSHSTWYQITFDNVTGWVNGSYLTIYNTHLVPIVDVPVTVYAEVTGFVNTGRLNIRNVPSPYFNQPITNVARNTSLTIIGRSGSNNWVQVRTLSGVVGWVNGRYVTITSGDVSILPITSG